MSIKPAPGPLESGKYALPTIKGVITADFGTSASKSASDVSADTGRQMRLRRREILGRI